MQTYNNRTPDSIRQELESYTEEGCQQLARFLQNFMANEHNGKNFLLIASDKNHLPYERMTIMLASAYDWFAYGN